MRDVHMCRVKRDIYPGRERNKGRKNKRGEKHEVLSVRARKMQSKKAKKKKGEVFGKR